MYGNIKTHTEGWPYRHIISCRDTVIQNIGRWVEYHLKQLSRQHAAYLKDTSQFLRYIEEQNQQNAPFSLQSTVLVSRDISNYYPSCDTNMCIESIKDALQNAQ